MKGDLLQFLARLRKKPVVQPDQSLAAACTMCTAYAIPALAAITLQELGGDEKQVRALFYGLMGRAAGLGDTVLKDAGIEPWASNAEPELWEPERFGAFIEPTVPEGERIN